MLPSSYANYFITYHQNDADAAVLEFIGRTCLLGRRSVNVAHDRSATVGFAYDNELTAWAQHCLHVGRMERQMVQKTR